MVRAGEIEHGRRIADRAETVWNWASPAGRVRAERRARLVAEAAGLREGVVALELGCGTGVFTRKFVQTGAEVVAVDVSPELIEQAADYQQGESVTFCVADAEALSFDDGTFDAVVGSSVLHHLDVDAALGEIRRVLRPGGRLAFAEPNMLNPQIALQRRVPWLREWAGESPEETAFVRWSLGERLRRAGFHGVRVRPFDFLHPVTPAVCINVVRACGAVCERIPLAREIAGSLLISAGVSVR